MGKHQNKFSQSINAIFVVAALVIMLDYILPGNNIADDSINIKKEREQYYNAASNFHYSFKVVTSKHQFSVSEDFAELVQDHKKIEYSISQIFKEVNWYRLDESGDKSSYSLRIISGLILPLLTILSILMAYRYKKNIGTLVFVLQMLLIADLVFLLN